MTEFDWRLSRDQKVWGCFHRGELVARVTYDQERHCYVDSDGKSLGVKWEDAKRECQGRVSA